MDLVSDSKPNKPTTSGENLAAPHPKAAKRNEMKRIEEYWEGRFSREKQQGAR